MKTQSRAAPRITIAVLACALSVAVLIKIFGGIVIIKDYTYEEQRRDGLIAEGIKLTCNAKPLGLTYSEGSLNFPNFGLVSTLQSSRDLISIRLDSEVLLSEAKIEKVLVQNHKNEEIVEHLTNYSMQPVPMDRPYDGIRKADIDPWSRFFIDHSSTIRISGSIETSKTKEVIYFDISYRFERLKFTSFITKKSWMRHILNNTQTQTQTQKTGANQS